MFRWVNAPTLIQSEGHVVPIEVKAGASGTLKSLRSFLASHPLSPTGIRLYSGKPVQEGQIRHLPIFAAGTLSAGYSK
ncbi:MAG: hypothetical protein SFV15_04805 [Polyangiaceae bacterium]|nr:hypothetical protein [Polyangiaceae bacterium]